MDIKLARKILSVFFPDVTDVMEEYLKARLEILRTKLEKTKDDRAMHELQGSIAEVRELLKVRDTAKEVINMDNYNRSEVNG